jgi:ribosomal protein L7/L12
MNTYNQTGVAGLVVLVLAVILAFAATAASKKKVDALRVRGLYPEEGRATDDDVRRLLQAGEKIMAIRCYRELHQVGLKEAKDAVESLEIKKP